MSKDPSETKTAWLFQAVFVVRILAERPLKDAETFLQFKIQKLPAGFGESAGIRVDVIPIRNADFFAPSVLRMSENGNGISEYARNSDHANTVAGSALQRIVYGFHVVDSCG